MTTTDVPRAYFLGGTLVLDGIDRSATPPAPFQWVTGRWRCPAVHYRVIRRWLQEHDIRNTIPRWSDVPLVLHDDREPHAYQAEAIQAWLAADQWGNIAFGPDARTVILYQSLCHSSAWVRWAAGIDFLNRNGAPSAAS